MPHNIYKSMYFSKKCQGEMYTGSSGTDYKIHTHSCILTYTICVPWQFKPYSPCKEYIFLLKLQHL